MAVNPSYIGKYKNFLISYKNLYKIKIKSRLWDKLYKKIYIKAMVLLKILGGCPGGLRHIIKGA
jgi:hypothetical protein